MSITRDAIICNCLPESDSWYSPVWYPATSLARQLVWRTLCVLVLLSLWYLALLSLRDDWRWPQKLQPEYASAAVRWNCSILVRAMQTRYILHLTIPTRRAHLHCTAQTEEMQLDLWISDCAFPCHQFLKIQIFKGLPSWRVLNLRGS